jgi:membrane fusion protein, heavy metal efflux system
MRAAIALIAVPLLLAGCGKKNESQGTGKQEGVAYAVTKWSDKTELFMEFPALVAGHKNRFAIHFTDLRNFKAQPNGSATVELVSASGQRQEFKADAPSRPGIFGADVQPSGPGKYRMSVSLNAPSLQDRHDVGEVEVYASEKDAAKAPASEEIEATKYLKEQQWNVEFATEPIVERMVRESITVPGEVIPRAGGEAHLSAQVAGRFTAASTLIAGTKVTKGATLGRIIPALSSVQNRAELEADVARAKADFEFAEHDYGRAQRLVAARAAPARRVDEAQATRETAEAKLKSVRTSLAQLDSLQNSQTDGPASAMFSVRSPISGVIAEVQATSGSSVNAGDPLVRVVATDSVYVKGNVPEQDAPRLRSVAEAEIDRAGDATPRKAGKKISAAVVLDPRSRTLPVIYELPNRTGDFAVGQSVKLRLFTSEQRKAPSIPASAIVDDAGQPIVFVQASGESFVRRPVKIGAEQNGYVAVEGVQPGERVVTRGAYLIRLAALSGQIPAHGHVH